VASDAVSLVRPINYFTYPGFKITYSHQSGGRVGLNINGTCHEATCINSVSIRCRANFDMGLKFQSYIN
jgi:hypothetical protein